jgi:eukaryotic-like serine/threonine-protein kinase
VAVASQAVVTQRLGGRFIIERKLGVGGMGAVYEAFDQRKNVHVAVKSLGEIDADAVHSFKAEFRDFQHLHHPNIVALDEFFSEGPQWYFTMELVPGREFLEHVRRPKGPAMAPELATVRAPASVHPASSETASERLYPGVLDENALRESLRQLTAALSHLHEAGKVHRDVKSGNVMVTPDNRAVLLDFGVAMSARGRPVQIAGTPLYMAPELFRRPATPSSDWYAVGVLLYQALTGRDPWHGDLGAIMVAKRTPPEHPSLVDPSIPEDLGDLCMSLIVAHAQKRAGRRAILDWIDRATDRSSGLRTVIPPDDEREVFIGRAEELRVMERAFDELVRRKSPYVLYVQGESGIGKSALVEAFVDGPALRERVVVLRGRLLEEELVPYKAVDGIVDAICEHFLEIGYEEVKPLLPEHFEIVADTFPVLRRVACVAELPRSTIPDPNERRAHMFASLKECLRRLADRKPLIVAVDDLQWSDADSLVLLNELLRGDDAPRFLLVATLRTERTGSLRATKRPPSVFPQLPGSNMPSFPVPSQTLWMSRLTEDEARAYVEARMASGSLSLSPPAEDVLHEANGHPLFIDELLRYRGDGLGSGELTLEGVLSERIGRLSQEHRRYLELVSISARPLSRGMFAKAGGLSHGEGLRALKTLRAGRLVRTGRAPGPDGDDWVDAFHYKVRNACLEGKSEAEFAELHRAIAETMEAEGRYDAEHLAVEWRECGESAKAAGYAEAAGDAAFEALAFDKAAGFYSDAIALVTGATVARERSLKQRLSVSLRNAGKGRAAASMLLELVADALPAEAFTLRCEALELLLRSGYIDDGLREVESVLAALDLSLAKSPRVSFAGLVWGRARLAVRGHAFREREASACSEDHLSRLDAIWSVCAGLGSVEPLSSFALTARYVRLALDEGEPMRVARAFAAEALGAAAQGNVEQSHEFVRRATTISERLPNGDAPIVHSGRALTHVMNGEWRDALSTALAARERIERSCVGAVGERSTAEEAELWALAALGRGEELSARVEAVATRAQQNADLYAGFSARSGLPNIAWLVRDQPDAALEQTSSALSMWSRRGVFIQHLFDLLARAQAHLYAGRPEAALEIVRSQASLRKKTIMLVPKMFEAFILDLECRALLARAAVDGDEGVAQLCSAQAKKLQKGPPWARAMGTLAAAGAATVLGNERDARALGSLAKTELEGVGLGWHLAAARALAEPSAADDLFAATGVKNPTAFARLFAPSLGATKR